MSVHAPRRRNPLSPYVEFRDPVKPKKGRLQFLLLFLLISWTVLMWKMQLYY